jgi:hypothetical protein
VLRGLQQHPLELDTAGGLRVSSLGNRHPGGAQAFGQIVADALELAEIEQPRRGSGYRVNLGEATHAVGERRHEGFRELALELGDLSFE